ncbi:MAG TPA: hypothetical protein IAD07_00535 [Candidatus Fimivicinus intestinavium]|nr:hypothetical protein [Candidatus Fimivicinus intestinavium]
MTAIIHSMRTIEVHARTCLNHWMEAHPRLALPLLFLGVPMLSLGAVSLLSTAVILPAAWFLGWL